MSSDFSPFVVILLGPPGSGKGTQARRLAKNYHLPQISTGDLFREQIALQSSIGKIAEDYITAGLLVPDSVVLNMLFQRIEQPDCARGFLLDGFPRTLAQAKELSEHPSMKAKVLVFCLDVPDDVIIHRASGRYICPVCHSIYNRNTILNLREDTCEKCGNQLHRRKDDEPEVVRKRLQVYHTQTQPLIEYYDQQGLLTTFNGTQHPDLVYSNLSDYIDNYSS